jgi:hypothetical protein
MGSAGVALQSTPDALAYNPAAAYSENMGINLSHTDWFAGLRHQSLAFVLPLSNGNNLGFHIISFGGDPFEQTTLDQQNGTGVMVDYNSFSAGVSEIMKLTDRFTVGLTGKYIREELYNVSGSAFAFDVGTNLVTSLPGFSIGMAMTNLGTEIKLEGRDLYSSAEDGTQYETSKWPLPLSFQTGFGWRILGKENSYYKNSQHSITIASDARHINEGTTYLNFGAEYGFGDIVFGRLGYISGHATKDFTFGTGVRVPLYLYIIYADIAAVELENLGWTQRVAISIQQRPGR